VAVISHALCLGTEYHGEWLPVLAIEPLGCMGAIPAFEWGQLADVLRW